MKSKKVFLFLLFSTWFAACSVSVRTSSDKSEEKKEASVAPSKSDIVELTFLQLNDVYEITPVENGKFGGMARVATVRKELLKENPNTLTALSGDFISPSAIGTSKYQGKRIHGAQMVDAMNAVGVDYVCFGNHEFDLGYEPLQERINQSKFTWISSNIQYTPSQEGFVAPFNRIVDGKEEPFPESRIITVKNSSGEALKVGLIGLCIGANKPPYIAWEEPLAAARRVVNNIKNNCDIIVALTHMTIDDDKELATRVPEINLILGGHEHTNMLFKVGGTLISKADANARSVYIHRLRWSSAKKTFTALSELRTIDASIADEPAALKVVNDWTIRAYEGFQETGFNPETIVTTLKQPLDGRETSIRFRQTNLGTAICNGMIAAAKKSKIAVFNSGSIRLDDHLHGVITQYDVIRTMPFGGRIVEVEMKASLLQKVLEGGMKRPGAGSFPQFAGVEYDSVKRQLTLSGKVLNANAKVWAIFTDYMLQGKEQGLEFFKKDHPDISGVDEPTAADDVRRDMRFAVIEYLKKN
jgi:2',3'-cyclic-nucleotide 2'-phosphodiesterase (5'-nucleotidase family)